MSTDPTLSTESTGPASSDGQMDFARYSDAQLQDLRLVLDANRYPLNAALLQQELDRRAAAASRDGESGNDIGQPDLERPPSLSDIPVQYTTHDGWRGWLQAKRRWQPFFGTGSVRLNADEVVLEGWNRTWLGASQRAEKRLAPERIRDVAVDGIKLSLSYQTILRLWRRLVLHCESPELTAELAARLPAQRSSGFERRWEVLRTFDHRLAAAGVRPWATTGLVTLNALVFLVFVLVNRAWSGLNWSDLLNWGANYGPLTTGAQWWRLLTALFLHGGFLHLLVNMWVLWSAGRLAERLYGNARYALIYLGSGLIGGMASIVWNPTAVTIGASGAIFGMLGAFLSYALAPSTRLPLPVLRTHWFSTAVFALFSLLNGFANEGIDNAAHLGGLVAGALLGLILARPLPEPEPTVTGPEAKDDWHRSSWKSAAAAITCVAALLGTGYWQVRGLGNRVTPPTAYMNAHGWLSTGEQKNLESWRRIGSALDQGAMSPAEFAREFRAEVLPFWQSTKKRLAADLPSIPKEQLPYAKDMLSYVDTRIGFIEGVLTAVDNNALTRSVAEFHNARLMQALARLERRRLDANAELAPHALASAPWVLKVRQFLGGGRACVERPAIFGRVVLPKDKAMDGPVQRHDIACRAQRAFEARDFSTLEALLHRYPPEDVDPIDGGTRHESVYSGLSNLFEFGEINVNDVLANLAQWKKAFPESVAPELAETDLFISTAWAARGAGYAKEVSQQQWQLFNERLAMARAALEDAEPRSGLDPEWFELRLIIGRGFSDPRADLGAVYSRGIAKFPRYVPLVDSWLNSLMPRWGGSFYEVEALIDAAAARWGDQADEAYARLYSSYADLEGDEEPLYSEGNMDWARIRRGFAGLLERFPSSDVLLNDYAYLACRAGKSEDYHALRPKLKERFSNSAWGLTHTLEWCDKHVH